MSRAPTSDTELAWAAGFFDGEGSTNGLMGGSRRHTGVRIRVVQAGWAGVPLLERFQRAVGTGKIYAIRLRTEHHQATWAYELGRRHDVISVLGLLWPWLGLAKRYQALAVLDIAWRTRQRGRICKRGHLLEGTNLVTWVHKDGLISKRGCRICRNWRMRVYRAGKREKIQREA